MKDATVLLKAWREKYPGAYDSVEDPKLLGAIKQKYPGAYDDYDFAESKVAPSVSPQKEPNTERSLGGFLGNVFSSGGKMVGDIATAVSNPADTASSLFKVTAGGVGKLIPGKQMDEGSFDALVKMYADRYGDWDKFTSTLYEDPVGVLADLSTLAAGAGATLKLGNLPKIAKAANTVAKVTDPVAMMAKGANVVTKPVTKAVKITATELLGKTTGSGSTAIRRALENPTPELKSAMRGATTETDIVNNFRDALQNVKDARSDAYRQQLAQLPTTQVLHITPVQNNLRSQLQKFNIKEVNGELDFSRSTVRDAAAQADVKAIYNDVMKWGTKPGDNTVAGVDILKRRIDDTYSPSSTARSMVQSVKDTTRNILNTVPGYQQMTKGYADASKFLDELKDLSLENKNPGTAVRKLTTLLNQNNNYRQILAEKLSQYTPQDLEGQLAGLNLSKKAPRGIAGPITGAGLLFQYANYGLSPLMVVSIAATSPRLMGEFMAIINKLPSPNINVSPGVAKAATVTSRIGAYQNAVAGE